METIQVDAGSSILLTLNALDPDYDALIYSSPSLPEGAYLDGSTGVFEWIPSVDQVGEYVVEFTVDDDYLSDHQSVSIFVRSMPDVEVEYMSLSDVYKWLRSKGYGY